MCATPTSTAPRAGSSGARSSTPARPAPRWSGCTSSSRWRTPSWPAWWRRRARLRVGDPATDDRHRPAHAGAPAADRRGPRRRRGRAGRDACWPAARRPRAPAGSIRPPCSTGVDHTMRVMREETFGPVLPIMAVDSVDEAIRLANDSDVRPHRQRAGRATPRPRARSAGRAVRGGGDRERLPLQLRRAQPRPGAACKRSGIGRTHGLARPAGDGRRSSTSPREFGGGPSLWWYPLRAGVPPLHGGGPARPPRPGLRATAARAARARGLAPLLAARALPASSRGRPRLRLSRRRQAAVV